MKHIMMRAILYIQGIFFESYRNCL